MQTVDPRTALLMKEHIGKPASKDGCLAQALLRRPVPILGGISRGRLALDCRCPDVDAEAMFLARWADDPERRA